MKNLYNLFVITGLFISLNNLSAQTIWTGTKIIFTKTDSTDWTLQTNQDSITNNVRITRANDKGIFNIAKETNYTTLSSPFDTEWAFGTTANIDSLTFKNWQSTHGNNPVNTLNKDMVLHLITDDIFIDIKFTSWTVHAVGGGFSYERSTDQSLSFDEFETNSKIKLFPNPASDIINISGLKDNEDYKIYNLLGAEIYNGTFSYNGKIDIKNFPRGLYFLKFQNGNTIKLIKK